MKSNTQIVHGGGWVTRQAIGRPRARFFGLLALLWLFVALCATYPFWNAWPQSFGYWEWLCVALLIPEPVFAVLAVVFFLTERSHPFVEAHHDPDSDRGSL